LIVLGLLLISNYSNSVPRVTPSGSAGDVNVSISAVEIDTTLLNTIVSDMFDSLGITWGDTTDIATRYWVLLQAYLSNSDIRFTDAYDDLMSTLKNDGVDYVPGIIVVSTDTIDISQVEHGLSSGTVLIVPPGSKINWSKVDTTHGVKFVYANGLTDVVICGGGEVDQNGEDTYGHESDDMFMFRTCERVTVRDMYLHHTAGNACIYVNGCKDLTIDNCRMEVASDLTSKGYTCVTISSGGPYGARRTENIVLTNTVLKGGSHSTLDIETSSDTYDVNGVFVDNCFLENVSSKTAINVYGNNIHNVKISNTRIKNANIGFYINRTGDIKFENFELSHVTVDSCNTGFYLTSCDDVILSDCIASNCTYDGYSILADSRGVLVNNCIGYNNRNGLWAYGTGGSEVNILGINGGRYYKNSASGLAFTLSDNVSITNTICDSNATYGITLSECDSVVISNTVNRWNSTSDQINLSSVTNSFVGANVEGIGNRRTRDLDVFLKDGNLFEIVTDTTAGVNADVIKITNNHSGTPRVNISINKDTLSVWNYAGGYYADILGASFASTVGPGTAPFTPASNTLCPNLNANYLCGHDSSYYATDAELAAVEAGALDTVVVATQYDIYYKQDDSDTNSWDATRYWVLSQDYSAIPDSLVGETEFSIMLAAQGFTQSDTTGSGGTSLFTDYEASLLPSFSDTAGTFFTDYEALSKLDKDAFDDSVANYIGGDLTALEDLSSTGIVARTASDTYVLRTITGTTYRVEVTYGDGVSGNPTISLPDSISISQISVTGSNNNYFIGSVGFGTTVPLKKVEIYDTSDGSLYLHRGSTTTGHYSEILFGVSTAEIYHAAVRGIRAGPNSYNGALGFYTQNTSSSYANLEERIRIDTDGNVGVGTIKPYAQYSQVGTTPIAYWTDSDVNISRSSLAQATDTCAVKLDISSVNPQMAFKNNVGAGFVLTTTSEGYVNLDNGLVLNTGKPWYAGSNRWDNGSNQIDGEQIADDTIDDDAIDWEDVTAEDISVDTSNFDDILSVSDSTIQLAFEALDEALDSLDIVIDQILVDTSKVLTLNLGGYKRLLTAHNSTDTSVTSIGNLFVNAESGGTYIFDAQLFVDADATGGSKFTLGGTCTKTSLVYQLSFEDTAGDTLAISARHTALGTRDEEVGTEDGHCRINGTITINTPGTLVFYYGQSVDNGTSTVLAGSYIKVDKVL